MAERITITLDDDLTDEVVYVRSKGREWAFNFAQASMGLYRRWTTFVQTNNGIIRAGGEDDNTEAFYGFAEAALCPANGTREDLERVRPGDLYGVVDSFFRSWFAGSDLLKRMAATQAENVTAISSPNSSEPEAPVTRTVRPKRRAS